MSNKTKWKIELETSSDLTINFHEGAPFSESQCITFSGIEATAEEMHEIISQATANDRVMDLRFPEGYRLLRYFTPYENVTSLSVSLDSGEEDVKLILDEVDDILNNNEENKNK